MKDSLKNAISLNRKATLIRVSIWKNVEENDFLYSSRNKIFLKNIGFRLIAIMLSKKIWMKEYRFQ